MSLWDAIVGDLSAAPIWLAFGLMLLTIYKERVAKKKAAQGGTR